MKILSNNIKGSLLVLSAAIFWGVSGTFGQYLLSTKHLNLEWLVTVRLLISGVVLLGIARFSQPSSIWTIWKRGNDRFQLILFSILGMLGVQYTYFAAIKFSNAATATVLQYIGPAIIASYFIIKQRKLPAGNELIAILLALTGTFLLVTHGDYKTLSISTAALLWGISSAFAMAFNSIQPMLLMKKFNTIIIIGWGMVVAGFMGSFIHAPWKVEGEWDLVTFLMMAFIIIFATIIAFHAYLISIKLIGATKSSLIACAEPLAAAFLGVIWLKTPFGIYDWIGTFLIIATILILSLNKPFKE